MAQPSILLELFAQTPPQTVPNHVLPLGLDALPKEAWIAAAAVGFLLLVLLVALLVRRARKPPVDKVVPPLPSPEEKLEIKLPPSEAELQKRDEMERAHKEAEALHAEREALEARAREEKDAAERRRLEAEAKALKEEEEEKKKEEYRAKREADKEAKERRAQEREEEERLRQEAELQAKARAEEEEAARVEAEAALVAQQAGQTLAQGLSKTRTQGFIGRLNQLFGGTPKAVDESVLGELEEVLFTADIGVKTASRLVDTARERARRNELSSADALKGHIRQKVEVMVDLPSSLSLQGGGPPHVVMVVGVNGAGKTTTIGKLARKLTQSGKRVVLAAGDTFRAAAAEQLDVWAERAQAQLVKGAENSDPGAVIFDAIKRAVAEGADVVIADTAGRLHTKTPLMEELKKVRRVMDKALPGAPHEVLLVLDATTGQNAIHQAKQFQEAVGVTAIALTKLDGTAKGGVIIGICDELKIPVSWVGVGESVEDLRPFEPKAFVSALFD